MKWYYIVCCVFWICLFGGLSYSDYLQSQQKMKELELELKLKSKW